MSLFNKLRTQKLLSFTMILLTLSLGIVIGRLMTLAWANELKHAANASAKAMRTAKFIARFL